MQTDVKRKMMELGKRATNRKTVCSVAKSQKDVVIENAYFSLVRKNIYNCIGGDK